MTGSINATGPDAKTFVCKADVFAPIANITEWVASIPPAGSMNKTAAARESQSSAATAGSLQKQQSTVSANKAANAILLKSEQSLKQEREARLRAEQAAREAERTVAREREERLKAETAAREAVEKAREELQAVREAARAEARKIIVQELEAHLKAEAVAREATVKSKEVDLAVQAHIDADAEAEAKERIKAEVKARIEAEARARAAEEARHKSEAEARALSKIPSRVEADVQPQAGGETKPSGKTPEVQPQSTEGDVAVRWHAYGSNYDVQFGEPETDNRLLRLRCLENGKLELSGPVPGSPDEELNEGQRLQVAVAGKGSSQVINARVEERGDGWNFVATVDPSNAAIKGLLDNAPVEISGKGYNHSVSGEGAEPLVKVVLASCTSNTRKAVVTSGNMTPPSKGETSEPVQSAVATITDVVPFYGAEPLPLEYQGVWHQTSCRNPVLELTPSELIPMGKTNSGYIKKFSPRKTYFLRSHPQFTGELEGTVGLVVIDPRDNNYSGITFIKKNTQSGVMQVIGEGEINIEKGVLTIYKIEHKRLEDLVKCESPDMPIVASGGYRLNEPTTIEIGRNGDPDSCSYEGMKLSCNLAIPFIKTKLQDHLRAIAQSSRVTGVKDTPPECRTKINEADSAERSSDPKYKSRDIQLGYWIFAEQTCKDHADQFCEQVLAGSSDKSAVAACERRNNHLEMYNNLINAAAQQQLR